MLVSFNRNLLRNLDMLLYTVNMVSVRSHMVLLFFLISIFQMAIVFEFHSFLVEVENAEEEGFMPRRILRQTEEIYHFLPIHETENSSSRSSSICLSPEKDVEWILDASCMDDPYLPSFSNTGLKHTCGLCGKSSEYLRSLRDEIAAEFAEKCKGLVVYGAAFGPKYEAWLREPRWMGTQSIESKRLHDTCFIMFVTDTNHTGVRYSSDGGSQRLIVVDSAKLPYKNDRRNTKLLKYNPGLLFPWADRVIWEDAKLLEGHPLITNSTRYTVPNDYYFHFNNTVERFGACASVMSLPVHKAAVGKSKVMSLRAHCDTIIAAAVKRPTVSDNLDVLIEQCNRYDDMYLNSTGPASQIFAQGPMADTAFIVYDMRTPACRKFNGDFTCSLQDEIHCFSDRDQLPFPSVVASTGLKLAPELDVEGSETRDRVYVNKNNVPMLHMAKRSCHWYYGNFRACAVTDKELPPPKEPRLPRKTTPGKLKIAVVVAGTLNRMMFGPTLTNLIEPMAKDYEVDYYGSFTTAKVKAYRSALIYPEHFQPDPYLPVVKDDDYDPVKRFIKRKVAKFGGYVGALNIQEIIDIDSEPILKKRRAEALKKYPKEEPDTRFPILDVRNEAAASRTEKANKNLLRMHLAINKLWDEALEVERENNFQYDYIIFMRDDTLWLNKFNITNLHNKEGDVFVLSCDGRNPPMDPMEENDHILITRREHADLFGHYYKTMFDTDVDGCMNRLSDAMKKKGKRGCNSEMFIKYVFDINRIKVTRVSQSEIPFQRSGNVRMPNGKNKQCFHKYCQSKESPLKAPKNMKECKAIDWKSIFLPNSNVKN